MTASPGAPIGHLPLPLELFDLIALQLDVLSIIRLSLICKAIRKHIITSLAIWRQINEREAQAGGWAPFSLPSTLSVNERIAYATRPYRVSPSHLMPLGEPKTHTFSQEDRVCFALKNEDACGLDGLECLLPGGRWFLGVNLTENDHARLTCWDIANTAEGVVSDPVASIDSQYPALTFPPGSCLCAQYDVGSATVTCLLTYTGSEDNMMHMEIIELSWPSEMAPQLRFVTETKRDAAAFDTASSAELDGDLVCLQHVDSSFSLWDWKRSWQKHFDIAVYFVTLKSPYIFYQALESEVTHIIRCIWLETDLDYNVVAILPSPRYALQAHVAGLRVVQTIPGDCWLRSNRDKDVLISLFGGGTTHSSILQWRAGWTTWGDRIALRISSIQIQPLGQGVLELPGPTM
ncbi:hypothetical protein DL93DRAFT_355924 [Clavulina sp. PMI_390]|nr:hypothetical protein DL93DRAFT_355924 [Clavulina sp. PMI_390]